MIPLFIPYVNRRDLLEKAVRSAQCPGVEVNVLDNSDGPSMSLQGIYRRPTVPLTAAQTLNWMQKIASADSSYGPFYLWMHNDAEAAGDSVQRLAAMAHAYTVQGRKWGVIFTNYDALAAYNTAAFDDVGPWDTFLEQYCTDNDMYRRLRLAGYEMINSDLPVKHEGSRTINSDPLYRLKVNLMYPCRQEYYRVKWGGDPGHETFDTPFGGKQ